MTVGLYLNLAWQTAVLTVIGYVAWRALNKIRLFLDAANTRAAIIYSFVFLLLLIPPALIYSAGFVSAIGQILAAL